MLHEPILTVVTLGGATADLGGVRPRYEDPPATTQAKASATPSVRKVLGTKVTEVVAELLDPDAKASTNTLAARFSRGPSSYVLRQWRCEGVSRVDDALMAAVWFVLQGHTPQHYARVHCGAAVLSVTPLAHGKTPQRMAMQPIACQAGA